MVENINEEEVVNKLLKLKGKLAKAKRVAIANKLIELGATPCVEGVYVYSDDNKHTFIVIYDANKIDDCENLNDEIIKINDDTLMQSRNKYELKCIPIEELRMSVTLFPSYSYYIKKRLAKSENVYANKNIEALVNNIR